MRISIIENDPGYLPEGFGGSKVLLDGVEITGVVTANEEDGWVRCRLERSEETFIRRGKVEIVAAAEVSKVPTRKSLGRDRDDG